MTKLLMFFGGNSRRERELGLPSWVPTRPRAFCQSVNRISYDVVKEVGAFKSKIAVETIPEILALQSNNLSFEDQAHKRAIEIKTITGDQPVFLMYSGGIDSTSALIAILNTWSPQELERVYVCMSYRSIQEFPEMWPVIRKLFGNRVINSLMNNDDFVKKGYMITGELGDQIMGADLVTPLTTFYGQEGIHYPWKNYIKPFYERFFGVTFRPNVPTFIDKFGATTEYCPFPIKTCFDFIWWYNFTNKWQLVSLRMLEQKRYANPKEEIGKIIHFFSSKDWQRWSLDNHDQKIRDTLTSYKYSAKEFIVKHTGFTNYLNKPKVGSLQHVLSNFDRTMALDENFNHLTFEQTLEYVNNG